MTGCRSHTDPGPEIDRLASIPFAPEFWRKYVYKAEPVLLQGAALRSAQFWGNDTEIVARFGDSVVKVEPKIEDRRSDFCGHPDGACVDRYRNPDGCLIMDSVKQVS